LRRHQYRRDDVRTLRGCWSQGVATGGQVVVVDYTGGEVDMNQLEERIASGTLVINGDGQMLSQKPDETWATIGHVGNRYGNIVVKYRDDEGAIKYAQGGRIAWRIHHGYWPTDDLSVIAINKNKADFRRENLMLVPRGQENRAVASMKA